MRLISRLSTPVLNSQKIATLPVLERLFTTAPNMAAKTIRLFPQNSLSFLTEGLGEIYDIKAKTDNFIGLNDRKYQWNIRGHQVPKVKFATRVTGGAISAASTIGGNQTDFIVAFGSSYYNPNDIIKLQNGDLLFVKSGPRFMGAGVFEYTVTVNTNDTSKTINTNYLQPGLTSGLNGNAYPELSTKGYISTSMAEERHINYLNKVRYDWSWSADAAATKFLIQDTVNFQGQSKKFNYITDQLLMNAMEIYHHNKEMALIYGRSTMTVDGRCLVQDTITGQDIVQGDGLIAQMADSCKQTYTDMNIGLVEDILTDMCLRMPKRTGNTILLTTGAMGYKKWGQIMRAEHKGAWANPADNYVQTKNGKIMLGAEYNAFQFQGNKIIVAVNNVFDHPANVSDEDSDGRYLESSKYLFIDMSSYDGVNNLQMIAKDGRSFVVGELDGIGGQDGKTSGKVSTTLDGSMKMIIGTMGMVMHNPYSSYLLEKKILV